MPALDLLREEWFLMDVRCTCCGDEFDPIEGVIPSLDSENFCSLECEQTWSEMIDAEFAYRNA